MTALISAWQASVLRSALYAKNAYCMYLCLIHMHTLSLCMGWHVVMWRFVEQSQ